MDTHQIYIVFYNLYYYLLNIVQINFLFLKY